MLYSQCNGAKLYYEDSGDGIPILFLHGVMSSHRFFEPQLTALSNEYRPIALEYRVHGRSEKRPAIVRLSRNLSGSIGY